MPILVSCWHCKRAVLVVPRMNERELAWLLDHRLEGELSPNTVATSVATATR